VHSQPQSKIEMSGQLHVPADSPAEKELPVRAGYRLTCKQWGTEWKSDSLLSCFADI
jgi:hypothetical protein